MSVSSLFAFFFFFNDTATTEIYTLSLHDALPICPPSPPDRRTTSRHWPSPASRRETWRPCERSEEHTSELQSQFQLVCRLLLGKKTKSHRFSKHTRTRPRFRPRKTGNCGSLRRRVDNRGGTLIVAFFF